MPSPFHPGATALISGAASGIGFAVARHCRTSGMILHLLDINASNLKKAKSILSETSPGTADKPPISTYIIDVSDASAWSQIKNELGESLQLDFLMLNAGAGIKMPKPFEDVEYFKKTFGTNFFGPLYGLETFLPAVTGGGKGVKAIVLTGSKQGITNPPGNPAYNASKAALKSVAESLSYSLYKDHPNISVHLLIPGWTFTGLSGNVGPTSDEEAVEKKSPGAWLPSQVAQYLVEGMEKGKFYVVCPDNDVTEVMDKARMEWAVREINEGKQPLSRWREDGKVEAAEWVERRRKELEEAGSFE